MRPELVGIISEIRSAGYGRKGELVEKYSKILGISTKTLYRMLAEASPSGRSKRCDAGESSLDDDTLRLIAAMMLNSVRGNGKQTMDIPTARQILQAQGIQIPVGDSRVNALLKERGYDIQGMKAPEPCVRMRSLHPNHVHQVDPSLCLLYYSPDGKQHLIRDEEAYKNKPFMQGKEKLKLWRYVMVDHYSGTICHRYYQTEGENALTLWEFLLYGWGLKENERAVFHGLPEILVCDKGSANTSGAIANALRSLRVKLIPHTVGNARAKGSVEDANNLIEKLFESRLKLQPVSSVDELNAYAEEWDALINANMLDGYDSRLTRAKMARTDLWLKIKPEDLVELPEGAATLLIKNAEDRKVDSSLAISYSGLQYSVAGMVGIRPAMTVKVQPILVSRDRKVLVSYTYDGEKVEDERLPLEMDEAGFRIDAPVFGVEFKRNADTVQDKARKELKALIGEDGVPFIEATDGRGIRALDAIAASGNSLVMPKVGKPLQVAPRPARRYSLVEASRYIRDRLGRFDASIRQMVIDRFPDGPTDEELEAVCEELLEKETRHA